MTTVHPSLRSRLTDAARRVLSFATLATGVAVAAGCPATQFPDEGPGQPSEWASGKAPPGLIGVCREPLTKRPPVINPALWENLRRCDAKTPRRYLRIGYGKSEGDDAASDARMASLLDALRNAAAEKDGNNRMLGLVRSLKGELGNDARFRSRIERASGRTFACDYAYLFSTTDKQRENLSSDACPAYAYDPKERRETCLFDTSVKEARWLASAWSCLAFTDTVGEGGSCHRLCAYDDFCSAQVGCSQPDFDLALCALGVCMPEKVSGIL
ncbi:MAG: hypothetical protein FJ096_14005 [Deltaproteobacteria bacterium]|nr:hypothetical protein [Deltaproteobacteria bacterium]